MAIDNSQRLLRTLRALGIDLNISSFNERLVLQKKIYFIQELGINLNYSLKWYLRGPYSSQLTEDAYQLSKMLKVDDNLENDLTREKKIEILGNKENRDRILAFISEIGDMPDKDGSYWYELISSLHFLMIYREKTMENFQEAMSQLRDDKSQVFGDTPDTHVKQAWNILSRYFYASNN